MEGQDDRLTGVLVFPYVQARMGAPSRSQGKQEKRFRSAPMSETSKRKVAAAAGVYAYLQEEEAAAAQALEPSTLRPPVAVPSPWVQAGRQEVMQRRYMLQFRMNR
jgi:hypothetical protein